MPTNLVVNGGFERPSEQSDPSPGWRNTAGPIDVFRNVAGLTAAEGTSIIEVDSSTAKDRIEQAVATTAGRSYVLSFQHSPRPGISNPSNKLDVYWNNTKLVTLNRSGNGLSVAVVADRDVHGHGNGQRPHLVPRERQRQPGGIARRRSTHRDLTGDVSARTGDLGA